MVSSAVYRYFPSRDELLTALIVDAYEAVGAAAEQAERKVSAPICGPLDGDGTCDARLGRSASAGVRTDLRQPDPGLSGAAGHHRSGRSDSRS